MRISDWSSDVCSSDLAELVLDDAVELRGRVPDEELVELYQRAWVVASASSSEGWGMSLTEAAACGTPAVATNIAGHLDAVEHERTGLPASRSEGRRGGKECVRTWSSRWPPDP